MAVKKVKKGEGKFQRGISETLQVSTFLKATLMSVAIFTASFFSINQSLSALESSSGSVAQTGPLLYFAPGHTISPQGDLALAVFQDDRALTQKNVLAPASYFLAKIFENNQLKAVSVPISEASASGPDPRGYGPDQIYWSRIHKPDQETSWSEWVLIHSQFRKASDLAVLKKSETGFYERVKFEDQKYSNMAEEALRKKLTSQGVNLSTAKLHYSFGAIRVLETGDEKTNFKEELSELKTNWFNLDEALWIEIESTYYLSYPEGSNQESEEIVTKAIVELKFEQGKLEERLLKLTVGE